MTGTPNVGATVKLKPARADAYGEARNVEYVVLDTFQKPGYLKVWVRLQGGTFTHPFNVVTASELKP